MDNPEDHQETQNINVVRIAPIETNLRPSCIELSRTRPGSVTAFTNLSQEASQESGPCKSVASSGGETNNKGKAKNTTPGKPKLVPAIEFEKKNRINWKMFNEKSNDGILKELEGEYTGKSFFIKNIT